MSDERPDPRIPKEVGSSQTLLYVIAALLVVNLGLTLSLWLRVSEVTTVQGPPGGGAIPPHHQSAVAETLPSAVTDAYNREDYAALHELFDPSIRSRISVESLNGDFRDVREKLGPITGHKFVIAMPTTIEGRSMVQLQYEIGFDGGLSERGVLSLVVVDLGAQLGLIGVNVAGIQ